MTIPSLRSFLKFLVVERLGFHRPSPVTHWDDAVRADFIAREHRLQQSIAAIDATRDVWSIERGQPGAKGHS